MVRRAHHERMPDITIQYLPVRPERRRRAPRVFRQSVAREDRPLTCTLRLGVGRSTEDRLSSKKNENFSQLTACGVLVRYMTREKLQVPLPFEQIMQRHQREIMRYLLRASGNREDAADLFQDTWLHAYRAYPRLQPKSAVRPWLYAIAINLCRNRSRDGARRARVIVPITWSSRQETHREGTIAHVMKTTGTRPSICAR